MTRAFFVSDLHGRKVKYEKLFELLKEDPPDLLFIGGDILPHAMLSLNSFDPYHQDFIGKYLTPRFRELKNLHGNRYLEVFIILGNDDPRFEEAALISGGAGGLWTYLHDRHIEYGRFRFYGYSYVPPTPFLLKDWEKFDVSRYVDPGAVSPLEGYRTFPVSLETLEYETIKDDLAGALKGNLERTVILFHAPPYGTLLDMADVRGKVVDHVPADPHIGSIAVKNLIEERQPWVTLHGHAHETVRLSGVWKENIRGTWCFSASSEGDELAVIEFDLELPWKAVRIVL